VNNSSYPEVEREGQKANEEGFLDRLRL